ncbi:MAG: hypothetical protein ACFB4J_01295 [Elainellaceae cyanobacterium]
MRLITKAALFPAILAASIVPADVIAPQLAQALSLEAELSAGAAPRLDSYQPMLEESTTLQHHRRQRRFRRRRFYRRRFFH